MKHGENWLVKSSLTAACGVFDLSRFLDPSDFTGRGNHYQSLTHLSCFLLFSLSFCWCQAHSASCWVCQVCVRSEMLNHYLLFRDLPCVCRAARTSLGLCTAFAGGEILHTYLKTQDYCERFHAQTYTNTSVFFFLIFWEYDFPPALLHTVAADVKSWFSAGKSLSGQVLWDSRGIYRGVHSCNAQETCVGLARCANQVNIPERSFVHDSFLVYF